MLARIFGHDSPIAKSPLAFASGLTLVLIWAGWFTVSRYGLLGNLTSADIALLRYGFGAFLSLPFLWWCRGKKIPWKVLPVLTLSYGVPYLLFLFQGLEHVPLAKVGVLLNGTLPILNAMMAWLFFKRMVSRVKWLAIALLFGANYMIIEAGASSSIFELGWNPVWIFLGTLSLSIYMTCVRKWPVDLMILVPAMSIGNFIVMLPLWYVMPSNLANATYSEIILQMIFQGAINQIMVIWLIGYTISRIGSVTTSVIYGLVPSVTALAGLIFLNEAIGIIDVAAIALCTTGMIVYSRSK